MFFCSIFFGMTISFPYVYICIYIYIYHYMYVYIYISTLSFPSNDMGLYMYII